MEQEKKSLRDVFVNNQVAFGVTLGVAAVIASFVLASAVKSIRSDDSVSVTGSSERVVQSDAAKWTFTITKSSSVDGYAQASKAVSDEMETSAKYLVGRGLAKEAITVQPLTSSMVCQSQNQVTYDENGRQRCFGPFTYSLSQAVIVESTDVILIKDLSLNAANALANQGIQIVTQSVAYYYTKLADLRVSLLGEAAKNARERAEALLQSSGNSIGGLTQASQGVFQITQVNSTDVDDYGSYDTSTIEKKVTAVVRASFSVK